MAGNGQSPVPLSEVLDTSLNGTETLRVCRVGGVVRPKQSVAGEPATDRSASAQLRP